MPPFIWRTVEETTGTGKTKKLEYLNVSYVIRAEYDESKRSLRVMVEVPSSTSTRCHDWLEIHGDEAEQALTVLQKLV